jgi:hypothetical protein
MSDNKLEGGGLLDAIKNAAVNAADQVTQMFSLKPVAKYMSGARCVLKINDELIGFAFNVSWNIQTTVTEIRTIDDYLPYELAPKHVIVTGTIGALHIPGAGFLDDSDHPMQSNTVNFLRQKYISIEVRDSQSDALLFMTRKALIIGRAESISVEQLSQVTLQFRAIGWIDEQPVKGITNPELTQL